MTENKMLNFNIVICVLKQCKNTRYKRGLDIKSNVYD